MLDLAAPVDVVIENFASDARRTHRADAIDIIEAWSLSYTDLDELERVLGAHGLPIGVERSSREAATNAWANKRGAVVEVDDRQGDNVSSPPAPWRFSDATTGAHGKSAFRGEHNREVPHELLGTDDNTLARWEADGVLSSRLPKTG